MNLHSNVARVSVLMILAGSVFAVVACDETLEATKLTDAGTTADGATDGSTPEASTTTDSGPDAKSVDLGSCAGKIVNSDCSPTKASSGCKTADGEVCEYSNSQDRFVCMSGYTAFGDLCQACDYSKKSACKPGFTCSPAGACIRYCCADADCNGHGACTTNIFSATQSAAGVCFAEFQQLCMGSGDAGDGGGSDAADASDAPDDGG